MAARKHFRNSMIDAQGYRANVGIVLTNDMGKLFWAKRIGMDAWQFPQGGIRPREPVQKAMYRELREETGLHPQHVEVIGCTQKWLRYRLPEKYIRKKTKPVCIGQKQIWYLLKLIVDEKKVRLDQSEQPEFDLWRWVDFWDPLEEIIDFKKSVYAQALNELGPLLFSHWDDLPKPGYSFRS